MRNKGYLDKKTTSPRIGTTKEDTIPENGRKLDMEGQHAVVSNLGQRPRSGKDRSSEEVQKENSTRV